jgi:hydroxymethylpyrimidine/phosphomethylpyrimidine kinase
VLHCYFLEVSGLGFIRDKNATGTYCILQAAVAAQLAANL